MRVLGLSRADWRRRAIKALAAAWRLLLLRTTFVVITGSVGKTTTKELILRVLSRNGRTHATTGSLNNAVDIAGTILGARPWHRYVVIEAGTDAPGWIRRASLMTRPDVAIILAVAGTHTNRFPTLADKAKEKASLLDGLRRGGVALLNDDDPFVREMANSNSPFRVVRFGRGEQANLVARHVSSVWPERLSLELITIGGTPRRIETQLVGEHWLAPVLAATATGLECGMPIDEIAAALAEAQPIPGRLDPQRVPSGATILRDEYNNSLVTYQAAFDVLRQARAERKLLAISSVRDSPESWIARLRRIVTEAATVFDDIILLGAAEDVRRAAKAARAAGFCDECVHTFTNMRDASDFLLGYLRHGDLLLLRGLSHDHPERIYHSHFGEVSCWLEECRKYFCDGCPELFAPKSAAARLVQIADAPVGERVAAP